MRLETWLAANKKTAPLFLDDNLVVRTFVQGSLKKLRRHPEFDNLIIETVEEGFLNDSWEGLIYVMHFLHKEGIVPVYVGKAEKKGVKNEISYNLRDIRKNQHAFARWGYGLAYHVGDLSHAMFGGNAYKKPSPKYRRWAGKLFVQFEPPTLFERVYVSVISWHTGMIGPSGLRGSVPSVEKEIIALASVSHSGILLNIDGR